MLQTRTALVLFVIVLLGGCRRAPQESSGTSQQASPTQDRKEAHEESHATHDTEKSSSRTFPVTLGKLQVVDLTSRKPVSEADAKSISALIARLRDMDNPDFGLAATLSGTTFLPIPGQRKVDSMLLTNHQIKPDVALRKLIELGPQALPLLLSALDDCTPTKITIEHGSSLGGMWFANELYVNPLSPVEKTAFSVKSDSRISLKSYTVTVGDVCFVALGQIVGRPYSCIRYQPTDCIVITSPTQNAQLRKQLRAIWSTNNPWKTVLDSLRYDYATQGVFNGSSLDGWAIGSEFQISAALRLLYYYPEETTSFLATRLQSLDVTSAGGNTDAWMKREVRNGVRTVNFIKAVGWSDAPLIQGAIRELARRTTDARIAAAIKQVQPAKF